jgi:transposase
MERISRKTKSQALALGAQGMKQADIAVELDISVSTVQRAKSRLQNHGDVEAGYKKPGPKGLFPPGIHPVCAPCGIS